MMNCKSRHITPSLREGGALDPLAVRLCLLSATSNPVKVWHLSTGGVISMPPAAGTSAIRVSASAHHTQ